MSRDIFDVRLRISAPSVEAIDEQEISDHFEFAASSGGYRLERGADVAVVATDQPDDVEGVPV